MITYGELVSQRFVAAEEQERLRRYLDARRRFFGFFGPEGREPDASALEALRQAEQALEALCEQLAKRVAILRSEVLPTLKELLKSEPESIQLLHGQIARLEEMVQRPWQELAIKELSVRCEAALQCSGSIRSFLLELRERLSQG